VEVVEGETRNVSTTQYIEDNTVAVASNVTSVSQFDNYFSHSSSVESDSIIRYLSKPFEIKVGQFSLGDTATTFTTNLFPYDFLSNTIYHRKVQGFLGFRGTLVLRLQVNGERFQQGRYMLCAVPLGGFTSENKAVDYFNCHAHTLVQRSQLPHAEIDIATQTACELRLPYTMVYDFYSLQLMPDAFRDVEYYVKIFPYAPLTTGTGSPNAKFTLWAHYEDVELVGQALPVELQSGRAKVKSKNTMRGANPSEREAKSAGVGPIESMAMKVSKASSYLNAVPFISQFTAPVKWAADITANVASVFGWSAPANLEPQHRFKITNAQYATNVNKVDMSLPLSLDVNASVVAKPEGPVAEDEMDVAYMASIFSYQDQFQWVTGAAEDTRLAIYPVGLWPVGAITTTHGGSDFLNLTPAQYLGTMFANWRGSVVFRFKFVKTEFHSGRISFDFNPETRDYISAAITDSVAPYVYRDIVDIRDITEYTLEIPYICNAPYLSTDINNTQTNKFGTLEIRVIDPLVAPDSVTQGITVLVEMALGKDAEFAVFANQYKITAPEFQLQSGEFKVIGGMQRRTAQLETSSLAIGEKITNLRTLVKRFVPYSKTPSSTGAICTIAPFSSSLCPFAGGFVSFVNVPDLYSSLSQVFAFSRGGVRLKISSRNSSIGPVIVKYFYSPIGYDVEDVVVNATVPEPNFWTGDYNFMNYANYVIENLSDFKMVEVSVPQYSKVHSRANIAYYTGTNYPMTRSQRGLTCDTFVQVGAFNPDLGPAGVEAAAPVKIDVLRAGAEDTNFSFFVSIPPYATSQYGGVPLPP